MPEQPREGDQPLPVRSHGPSMHSLVATYLTDFYVGRSAHGVADDLMKRLQVGIERYGQPLQAFNGRDAKLDLYEELLDAVVYARQVQAEADDPSEQEYIRKRFVTPLIKQLIDLRKIRDADEYAESA
jgi:hypothetical protein